MRRREFIAFLGSVAIAAPRKAIAQTSAKVYHLAVVSSGGPVAESSPNAKILLGALTERGYTLGQNLAFEFPRGATEQAARLPQFMGELKASKVDVIVAYGYPTALAAKMAGIPTVVAFGVGDPVATGLVESLSRPGGTITGISDVATMLTTKRMGLLKELVPNLRRVAMLWNKDDLGMSQRYAASAKAAESMGVTVGSARIPRTRRHHG